MKKRYKVVGISIANDREGVRYFQGEIVELDIKKWNAEWLLDQGYIEEVGHGDGQDS